MGERETKISGKESKGDNTSGRTITVNFLGISDQPPVAPEEKPTPSKKPYKKVTPTPEDRPLTTKQEKFCQYYVKMNNGKQAAIKAGYSKKGAEATASQTLRLANVAKRIKELRDRQARPSIASGAEVMELLTKMARGEIKDEVGLEISPSDRLKALTELAKRTIDLDQKLAGKSDNVIEIKLDWKR